MLDIEIDVTRALHAFRSLKRWPWRETYDLIGHAMVDEVQETLIDRKADPQTGEPWAPWSESYKASGAPFHGGHSLLFLTGEMAGSVRSKRSGDTLLIGASSPAQYHINGDGVPVRDFLSVGPEQADRILNDLASQLEASL